MERFENLPIGELIRKEGFDCTCGRHHGVDLKYIKIERGALNCVPGSCEGAEREEALYRVR